MTHESVHPNGVHVAGTFQSAAGFGSNWNPGGTAMTDADADQVYQVTVMVPPGTYLYKFVNGNTWQHKPERPSSACAINDGGGNFNRQVTVGDEGLNLPALAFDSCNAILKLSVNMQGQEISDNGIHVMGDFQEAAGFSSDWDPSSVAMQDPNQDGTFEIQLPIPPGTYQYVFVNGNEAAAAENPPGNCTIDIGGGIRYRQVTVPSESQPSTHCYNTCDDCDPRISTDYTTEWWNDAVFYEVFVRSFYDSDGDGIGDFRGIIEKLDYLNDGDSTTTDDLGITGIWLMPMMQSPTYHGYDVTDYYATEQDYGTMEDFQAFLDAAHERGIRVIIDFVMNHSSNQHPWFVQSVNDQNGFRDWYIWSENHPGFSGPWGQNVWHQRNGDYYYGLFWGGMPDLNYDNPSVKEELFNITEFWLEKGVDGFRLDAIKYLDEDGAALENTPETFTILEEFNSIYKAKNPAAFTVGEVWSNTAAVIPYVQNNRLDVCFEFNLAGSIISSINSNNPAAIRNQLNVVQVSYPKLQYATFLTNHDIDRIYSQFGSIPGKMKQAASLYLTLPGIPFIYYGEEIGMTGTGMHENLRRPMQWSNAQNAGFSAVNPWYPVGSNFNTNNVATMEGNENSLLNHYKSLIHIRNAFTPLRRGYLLLAEGGEDFVLSYARIHQEEAALIVNNFGTTPHAPHLSLEISSLPAGPYRVTEALSNNDFGLITINENGGFSEWQPGSQTLNPRDTWVLTLQPMSTSAVDGALAQKSGIELFPNPTSNFLSLEWNFTPPESSTVQILDVTGKLIRNHEFAGTTTTLNVQELPEGTYFIRVQSGDFVRTLHAVIVSE